MSEEGPDIIHKFLMYAKATFQDILKPQGSLVAKIVGILIGSIFYGLFGILIAAEPRPGGATRREAVLITNSMALAVGYCYSWSETNPHEGQALDNKPIYEIVLMLSASSYLLGLLSTCSAVVTSHHTLLIIVCLELLIGGKGANVAVTFLFLIEITNLFYVFRRVAVRPGPPSNLFKVLFILIFIPVRIFVLLHLIYNVTKNQDIPEIVRGILILIYVLYIFSFYNTVVKTDDEDALEGTADDKASRRSN